jgi:hypothetical protein
MQKKKKIIPNTSITKSQRKSKQHYTNPKMNKNLTTKTLQGKQNKLALNLSWKHELKQNLQQQQKLIQQLKTNCKTNMKPYIYTNI